jgi:RNA polymerase sigma-70 factor, ECF subfamily
MGRIVNLIAGRQTVHFVGRFLSSMNSPDVADESALLVRAGAGDMDAWGAVLAQHHQRLQNLVSFRLDQRLRGRVDPADVMQEAFIAATQRRTEFFEQSTQSLFLWLRWMVGNALLELHRHHFGAQMRDARREVASDRCAIEKDDHNTRTALIAKLSAGGTGPATAAVRLELSTRLNEALSRMDEMDREVLALRHYEQLTSAETAQVLGIQERAAAKRYTRALERLREMLAEAPGGLTGLRP